MHISGKIAAWLVAVGLLIGSWFAVKALAVRDKWMALAQKNEAEIKKNDEEIAKKIKLRDEKRTSLARTMFGWDRYWLDVPAVVNGGNLSLQLGSARGVQQNQVLYVFIPNPDGTSAYLGDFKVTRVGDNGAEARPESRRRPDDVNQMPPAPNARVRTRIPTEFLGRLSALDQQLLAAELTIAANDRELKRQATSLPDPPTHCIGDLSEMSVAVSQFAPGVADADDWPGIESFR